MQQTTIDSYETNLLSLMNISPTVANLSTVQTLAAGLDTDRNLAISQQNETEQQNYLINMLQSNILNCIIKSGKLIECYNDYDDVIANEPDVEAKRALIEAKQLLKETLKTEMDACPFFKHIKNISKFVNN